MAYETVREAMSHLTEKWPRNRGTGIVQYTLTGSIEGDLSQIHVVFEDGVPTVFEGPAEDPDADIQVSATNFIGMCNGTFDVQRGWMTKAFVVTGRNVSFVRNLRVTR